MSYKSKVINRSIWVERKQAAMKTACISWSPGTKERGKRFSFGRRTSAARAAMEKHLGRKLTSAECVCHHCDNPPCINLEHLFIGSRTDNQQDMVSKGRNNSKKTPEQRQIYRAATLRAYSEGRMKPRLGSKNEGAKLTEDDVRIIRASSLSQPKLAAIFGVAQSRICQIRRRQGWNHV